MQHAQAAPPSGRPAPKPDCSAANQWPIGIAQAYLQSAGFVDRGSIDISKTRVVEITSQPLGHNRYRKVHDVVFTERSGHVVEAIVVSEAAECSATGSVDVYVVAMHLGGK